MSGFTRGIGCSRFPFGIWRCSLFPVHSFFPSSSVAYSSFYDRDLDGGSWVYRRALQFGRPPTISHRQLLPNSVSLIGSVVREVKLCNRKHSGLGVHTMLELESPRESGTALRSVHSDSFDFFHSSEDSYLLLKQRVEADF